MSHDTYNNEQGTASAIKKKRLISAIALGVIVVVGGGVAYVTLFSSPERTPHVPVIPLIESTPLSSPSIMEQIQDKTPPIVTLIQQPMNAEAAQILAYSQQLQTQEVRKLALTAQQQADTVSETLNNDTPSLTAFTSPTVNDAMIPTAMAISISEQLTIKSIMSVGKRREAMIGFGDEMIPVKKGTHFQGVVVLAITDNSITFNENGKKVTRYVATARSIPTMVKDAQ